VNEHPIEQSGPSEPGVSRRSVLKKGAIVVGGAAFAVPAVQTISMSRAAAQNPSGGGGGGNGGNGGPTGDDHHHHHHKPWW